MTGMLNDECRMKREARKSRFRRFILHSAFRIPHLAFTGASSDLPGFAWRWRLSRCVKLNTSNALILRRMLPSQDGGELRVRFNHLNQAIRF